MHQERAGRVVSELMRANSWAVSARVLLCIVEKTRFCTSTCRDSCTARPSVSPATCRPHECETKFCVSCSIAIKNNRLKFQADWSNFLSPDFGQKVWGPLKSTSSDISDKTTLEDSFTAKAYEK